jgi:hypothetical protein
VNITQKFHQDGETARARLWFLSWASYVLGALLVCFKLTHVIDSSWFLVVLPFFIPALCEMLVIAAIVFISGMYGR